MGVFLLSVLVAAPFGLIFFAAYILLVLLSPVPRPRLPSECCYLSAAHPTDLQLLPSVHDPASVDLTLVVPAYNERERLPIMLDEAITFLEAWKRGDLPAEAISASKAAEREKETLPGSSSGEANGAAFGRADEKPKSAKRLKTYEVLVVDDGSKDGTAEVALDFAKDKGKQVDIRVVRLEKNRGKGGAVKHGVQLSRGARILFADADGATRFSDLYALDAEMDRIETPTGHGVVVGSRAHLVGSEAVVKRSFLRNFLMRSFHLFLSLLLRPPRIPFLTSSSRLSTSHPRSRQPLIRDTQCGFKLFSRRTAALIFPLAHIDRWIFDVELLLLAEMASDATLKQQQVLGNDLGSSPSSPSGDRADGQKCKKEGGEGNADPLLSLPVPISELAVHWTEVGGSKIHLLKDSVGMALDLLVIRGNYGFGRWKKPGAVEVEPR